VISTRDAARLGNALAARLGRLADALEELE